MRKINLSDIDASLLADLGDDTAGFEAFEADHPNATVSNQGYHIVYNADAGRGGIVFVGSGSSGNTAWTDAASADDVLARWLADELTG
ncbi:Uncharacterised protein [Burkholderia pseudomallei]|uniref:hypothetical protein n=1 Tax=Burkholderia pseudomallei TaxID=28450 RepID=UPI0005DD5FB1|nr:hypothetical protein [Burkholderia pseudomallei]CFU00841.1 Uncharacterised protein [Burkholderia pseudomallei]CPI08903.1 Uncharacterised protein [Burkholderia pseudomallei]